MKKILLLSLVAFVFTSVAGKDGIHFEKKSWKKNLISAKTQDKLIFLDAYTTWCGPCKEMEKNVFPDKEIGAFFNSNFINVKIDMEKGEGIELAKKYKIRAYPTLLFINGKGELVHFSIGGLNKERLLALGLDALDESKQIGLLLTRFENGDQDPVLLKQLVDRVIDMGIPQTKNIVSTYLKNQDNLLTKENVNLIFKTTTKENDEYFNFMVENRVKFEELLVDWKSIDFQIARIKLQKYFDVKEIDFKVIEADLAKVLTSKETRKYTAEFKVFYYKNRYYYYTNNEKDKNALIDATVSFMDNYGTLDFMDLNGMAWTMFELSNDPEVIKKACKWAEKSVEYEKNFYNMDTLAHIYDKLGEKEKAKKFAKDAIALGEAAGEDVSATKKLLEK